MLQPCACRLQLDVMPTDKGKLLVYDKVAKSADSSQSVEIPLTLKRKQLRSCLSSLALLSMGTR